MPFLAHGDAVDLLFSPGFVSPLWGRFRKVATIHDMYFYYYPGFVRPWQRRYWRLFVPLSLRAADAVIAVSDSTISDIGAAYKWSTGKLKRIYLGANALIKTSNETMPQVRYCLVVGNITPNKNIETILDAFTLLARRGVDCRAKQSASPHTSSSG